MKKRLVTILSTLILLTSVATTASANTPVNTNNDTVTPFVNTGWIKKNNIEARVYTDRTGTYPASDTYIGITGEKRTSGAAYYQLDLWKKGSNGVITQVATTTGTFSSSTGQWQVKIDDILSKNSSGTFIVNLKIFSYGDWDSWLGDWETSEFLVNN